MNNADPGSATTSSLRRLHVKHETVYHYQSAVALGYSLACLTPRVLGDQRVLEHQLSIMPKPRFQHSQQDAFGNTQLYFEVHRSHSELRIQSSAIVEREHAPDVAALAQPWESARPKNAKAGGEDLPAWDFVYPTALVPLHHNYTEYARAIFTPSRPLGEALLAFNHQIHTDFQYLPGATAVDTPLAQVWENRAGVCQDFAHFAIAALRGIGLAAAYVSGYLLTRPRDGESKRVGADASHAWFAVWIPDRGWIHLDPTNDIVVGDEHIVLAIGRDYSDSPPVKGVCFSGGLHQLSVAVTVNELTIDETTDGVGANHDLVYGAATFSTSGGFANGSSTKNGSGENENGNNNFGRANGNASAEGNANRDIIDGN